MDRSPGHISGMLRLSVLQVNCSRASNKSSSKMLFSGMHELIRRSRTVRLWTQTWFPVSTEDRVHLVIIPKGTDQTLSTADGIFSGYSADAGEWSTMRCWSALPTEVGMAAAQIPNECVTVSRQPKILGSLHSSIWMSQHIYLEVSNKLHMVAPACNPSSQKAEAEWLLGAWS